MERHEFINQARRDVDFLKADMEQLERELIDGDGEAEMTAGHIRQWLASIESLLNAAGL